MDCNFDGPRIEGCSSSSLKEPKIRTPNHPVGIFLRLSLSRFSTSYLDKLLKQIRGQYKENDKEEFALCFTDVRITPDKVIGFLRENKISTIQTYNPKNISLNDHLWRFPTYEKNKVECVLNLRLDLTNADLKVKNVMCVTREGDLMEEMKNDVKDKSNTCLVFSNYLRHMDFELFLKAILESMQAKKVTGGQNYSVFAFKNKEVCLRVLQKLQSRVLLITFKNNVSEADQFPTGDDTKLYQTATRVNTKNQDPMEIHTSIHDPLRKQEEKKIHEPREQANHYFYNDERKEIIVLWDMENCGVKYNTEYVKNIRKIYSPLKEEAFLCVTDIYKQNDQFLQHLFDSGVTIIHEPTDVKQTADKIIISLIKIFSSHRPQKANIVFMTGDSDYLPVIRRVKAVDRNQVYLIHRGDQVTKQYDTVVEKRISYEKLIETLHDLPLKTNSSNENETIPTTTSLQENNHNCTNQKNNTSFNDNGCNDTSDIEKMNPFSCTQKNNPYPNNNMMNLSCCKDETNPSFYSIQTNPSPRRKEINPSISTMENNLTSVKLNNNSTTECKEAETKPDVLDGGPQLVKKVQSYGDLKQIQDNYYVLICNSTTDAERAYDDLCNEYICRVLKVDLSPYSYLNKKVQKVAK